MEFQCGLVELKRVFNLDFLGVVDLDVGLAVRFEV